MNNDIKEDVRTIRTKRDLADALIFLIYEKKYDDISIKDITDKALVAKNTFYNNFEDKNKLLEYVFERYRKEMFETLNPILASYKGIVKLSLIRKIVNVVVSFFFDGQKPINNLVRNDESKTIFYLINEFVRKSLYEVDNIYDNILTKKIDTNITINYLSGAISSSIYYGIKDNNTLNKDKLIKAFIRLSYPSLI